MDSSSKRTLRTKASSNLSMCQDDYSSHKPSKKLRDEMDKLWQLDFDSESKEAEEGSNRANSQFNIRRHNIARSDFARQGGGFSERQPASNGIPYHDVQEIFKESVYVLIEKMKENFTNNRITLNEAIKFLEEMSSSVLNDTVEEYLNPAPQPIERTFIPPTGVLPKAINSYGPSQLPELLRKEERNISNELRSRVMIVRDQPELDFKKLAQSSLPMHNKHFDVPVFKRGIIKKTKMKFANIK